MRALPRSPVTLYMAPSLVSPGINGSTRLASRAARIPRTPWPPSAWPVESAPSPGGSMAQADWKVLVTDGLAPEAVALFKEDARFHVDVRSQTSPAELNDLIGGYDALIVRSATKVTADVIGRAKKLKAIARA